MIKASARHTLQRVKLDALTAPQRDALRRFKPGVQRTAYPDINPRTASALWSMGLVKGVISSGNRYFILTELGVSMRGLI
jgi:hypothetical protein